MNPKSYRNLARSMSSRVRCPVCHEEVYSRGGIHPQCAVRQADPPRLKTKSKGEAGKADPAPGAEERLDVEDADTAAL